MKKWIAGVDLSRGYISALRVSNGAVWLDMPRAAVLADIKSRKHEYRSWYYDLHLGRHIEGPQVRAIEVQENYYLRTDTKRIAADKLDSLSSACPFHVGPHLASV